MLDTALRADTDGSNNVIIRNSAGSSARFGRGTTGLFVAPSGSSQQLMLNSDGTYTLRDVGGTSSTFNAAGQLASISDAAGHAVTLTYTAGRVTRVADTVSGRGLTFSWNANGHVSSVTTDPLTTGAPGLVWTYTYNATDADALTSVCSLISTAICTQYSAAATPVNRFMQSAMDLAPASYWPLTTASPTPTGDLQGSLTGALTPHGTISYSNTGSPLTGSQVQAARLDGTSAYLTMGDEALNKSAAKTIQLWFKTSAAGVLISAQDQPVGGSTAPTAFKPVMYVGTDGKLYAGLPVAAGVTPGTISSTALVNNNTWHLAALVIGGGRQVLYVDGVEVGNLPGVIDASRIPNIAIGAGTSTGSPAAPNGQGYFNGTISDLTLYRQPITSEQAAALYAARVVVPALGTALSGGAIYAQLTYNSATGRVVTLIDKNGSAWTLGQRLMTTPRIATVKLQDSQNRSLTYEFQADNGDRLQSRTQSYAGTAGTVQTWEWNGGQLVAHTDEVGYVDRYTYDEHGNTATTVITNAALTPQTPTANNATYFWNSGSPLDPRNGVLITSRDARSTDPANTVTKTLDAAGNVLTTTYPIPAGQSTQPVVTNTYSDGSQTAVGGGLTPRNLLLTTVGARGESTTYAYFSTGDIASITYPSGLKVSRTYDGWGRKSTETSSSGATTIGTTSFTYDATNRLIGTLYPAVTDAVTNVSHQLVESTTYDAAGNATVITSGDAKGNDSARVTNLAYNNLNQLTSTTTPDGQTTTSSYNWNGDVAATTRPDGIVVTNNWNERHQLNYTVMQGPGVDPLNAGATQLITQQFSHDASGLLAAEISASGQRTTYTYGGSRALKSTALNGGVYGAPAVNVVRSIESSTYDDAGNVVTETRFGVTTTYTYDPAGKIASQTVDPDGLRRKTTYSYDLSGNVVREIRTGGSLPGGPETEHTYNGMSELLTSTVHGDGAARFTTTWTRDARGLITRQTNPDGNYYEYTYNAVGVRTKTTNPAVTVYDGATLSNPGRTVSTEGFNTFGDLTSSKNPKNAVSSTTYDTSGRPVLTTLPTYTPAAGSPLTPTSHTYYTQMGQVDRIEYPGYQIGFSYNPMGFVTGRTEPSATTGNTAVWQYRYDRLGNVIESTSPTGVLKKATFNTQGEILADVSWERSINGGQGVQQSYTRDINGNVVGIAGPLPSTIGYNAANEVVTVNNTIGITTLRRDELGRVNAITDPDKVTRSTVFDLAGRAVANKLTNAGLTTTSTQTYDSMGRVVTSTSPAGRVTDQVWDARGQLAKVVEHPTSTTTTSVQFNYDKNGNRTRILDGNSHATTTYFNVWDSPESVTEDANGSPQTYRTSYNIRGDIASTVAPGGISTTNGYDPRGNLINQTGAGASSPTSARTFTYNDEDQLTSFSAPGGTQALTYWDQGDVKSSNGPAGAANYSYTGYHAVTQLAMPGRTSSYTYDAAGRLAQATDGLTGNKFTFQRSAAGRDRGYTSSIGTTATPGPSLERADNVWLQPAFIKVKDAAGTPTMTQTFGWDQDSNLVTKTELGQKTDYTYDGASRLLSSATGGATTNYTYDNAGNRTSAGTTTYTYNARNQLVSDNAGGSYTYNLAGQLTGTTAAAPSAMTYDAFDRLITDNNVSGNVSYTYDALGRVSTRKFGTATSTFAYADLSNHVAALGTNQIAYLPDGTAFAATRAAGVNDLLVTNTHDDVIGSFSSSTGAEATRRLYNPWGVPTSTVGTNQPIIGFQSGYTDTVTAKTNADDRWYGAKTATFVSRDPATISAPPTSAPNKYAYGANNPLKYTDRSGNGPETIFACAPQPAVAVTCSVDLAVNGLVLLGSLLLATSYTPPVNTTAPVAAPTPTGVPFYLVDPYYFNDDRGGSRPGPYFSDDDRGASRPGAYYSDQDRGSQIQYRNGSGGAATAAVAAAVALGGGPSPFGSGGTGTRRRGSQATYRGSGDSSGTSNGQQGSFRNDVYKDHVAANLLQTIDWGLPGTTPTVDRPFSSLADATLIIASDQVSTPTATAATCTTTCEQELAPPVASAGGGGSDKPPTGPPVFGTATPDPDEPEDDNSTQKGGAEPVRLGQAGENAVRAEYNIGEKIADNIPGTTRTRIFDGLNDTTVTEVKNVAYQANTQQIRDILAYAKDKGLQFDLFVRAGPSGVGTTVSKPLLEAIDGSPLFTLRYIP